ncbi:MAG: rubredoxin [Anaerovoracaceae bacterium]
MAKYVCSICGYVYDEAKGIPESGISAGTSWDNIPESWVCPLCAAPKSEFYKQDESAKPAEKKSSAAVQIPTDIKEFSLLEMSALCTNLSRGCEKQYKAEEAALFAELAQYFKSVAPPAEEADYNKLINMIEKDLEEWIPNANAIASEEKDRGALRALTWSEKVTRILNSVLSRYHKEGEAMIENSSIYVCTICGFIYIGENLPELCPVCKVPNWKMEKVEGGHGND